MPEAQHNEFGVSWTLVQRLPPIRASPPSVRRSELQRRAQQKLKEATYVHVVPQGRRCARRSITIDGCASNCPNLTFGGYGWRLRSSTCCRSHVPKQWTALRRPSRLQGTYALGPPDGWTTFIPTGWLRASGTVGRVWMAMPQLYNREPQLLLPPSCIRSCRATCLPCASRARRLPPIRHGAFWGCLSATDERGAAIVRRCSSAASGLC